jgi:hypothetical protein
MTAHLNPIDFANLSTGSTQTGLKQVGILMRPNVTEHFWGYEVRPTELAFDIAVLLRSVCGILRVATLIAAAGIWLMSAMAFVAQAFAVKLIVSIVLMCISIALSRVAARGTSVRVQIDTAAGEVREVVDGRFGSDIVLARYGFDAIDAVSVVASRSSASLGQIQINVKDICSVPAGDGSLLLIAALRNRLASDVGLEPARPQSDVAFEGPLLAA